MKILLEKRPQGLFPLYDADKEKLHGIKNGATFERDFKLLRNPEFHRLVFKFLNIVVHYQNDYIDFDKFRDRVTFLTGSYQEEIILETSAKTIVKLKLESWSFDKMLELEFRALFNRIKDVCWKHYVVNDADQDEVERRMRELIRFD